MHWGQSAPVVRATERMLIFGQRHLRLVLDGYAGPTTSADRHQASRPSQAVARLLSFVMIPAESAVSRRWISVVR